MSCFRPPSRRARTRRVAASLVRVLLDTCVWGGARADVEVAGHDVVWVGELPEDPGDEAIRDWALHDDRILVTLDKDFGELAILHQKRHAGIVRLVDLAAAQQGPRCREVLDRYAEELAAGAIVTAEPTRTRVRPPERRSPS